MADKRIHFVFKGQVQGVGFRYRAVYAAQMLELSGWVENRWDGAVEMEVQGDEERISMMLEKIMAGTYVEVESFERWELPLEREMRGFHVRGD